MHSFKKEQKNRLRCFRKNMWNFDDFSNFCFPTLTQSTVAACAQS